MILPRSFRRSRRRLAGAHRLRLKFLLNETEFREQANRERARADRNGLPLAILIVALPRDHATERDIANLATRLQKRLRVFDTAGQLKGGLIAVLLPDTPKSGAWKVASDICEYYPLGPARPDCEVFVYPDDSKTNSEQLQSEEEPAAPQGVATFESFFAYPVPMLKRSVDVIGASVGLVFASPLFAVLAMIVKITSPGPVLFAQLREGHGGREFRMYKLRSMHMNAHLDQSRLRAQSVQDGPAFKMPNDPRTTWIGRFLRRTSLDELPQLWNVLMGDMSLVGPRPLPLDESRKCAPWQRNRLAVRPGLTCVWQVRGRSTVSFESWMRMDLKYLRRRSFIYDLQLLLSTIPSLVLSRGPR